MNLSLGENQSINEPSREIDVNLGRISPDHRSICGISRNEWRRILHGVNCLFSLNGNHVNRTLRSLNYISILLVLSKTFVISRT